MKFSAIIPAYNEWPRIAGVIETALGSALLDEIIVVDDGSTDTTKSVIETFTDRRVQKVFLAKNGGKAQAVMAGVEKSSGDYIVMLDSDLIWLLPSHIDDLIRPVQDNKADTTLSMRQNSLWIYKLLGSDFVSGERVIPKAIFRNSEYYTSGKGFGLEVKINAIILRENLRIQNVFLPGVITPRKSAKVGWWKGFLADMRMVYEICATVSVWQLLRQMWRFSRFGGK